MKKIVPEITVIKMDWATGGIDMSMVKYAGKDCIDYVNVTWRRIETMLILGACIYLFCWSYPKVSFIL